MLAHRNIKREKNRGQKAVGGLSRARKTPNIYTARGLARPNTNLIRGKEENRLTERIGTERRARQLTGRAENDNALRRTIVALDLKHK